MTDAPPDHLRHKRAELAGLQRATRRTRTMVIILAVVEIACVVAFGFGWFGKG
ncbi:MAG TPA: hypothetical protein PLV41_01550 [Miltoncostaeales bacterium]|jgi:hypothetical protein|nr:hypothetical protein [Miltoncostaeales bacterium]